MDVRTAGYLCVLGPTILMEDLTSATSGGRFARAHSSETQQQPSVQAAFSPSLLMAGAMNRKHRREPEALLRTIHKRCLK
jgi:hypothetical protein